MSHVQDEMEKNSCITMSRHCSDCGKGGIGMTTKADGWTPELCAKARREEVEYIRRHKMYTRVPREICIRETGKTPVKTGWVETDNGQRGMPNVRARWVAKEYKTHARPELYASTPPLETLNAKRKSWHLSMYGERTSTLQHEEEY